jgi:hypothetical protein
MSAPGTCSWEARPARVEPFAADVDGELLLRPRLASAVAAYLEAGAAAAVQHHDDGRAGTRPPLEPERERPARARDLRTSRGDPRGRTRVVAAPEQRTLQLGQRHRRHQ